MLIVASTAMVNDKRAGLPVRWTARIAFVAGVGASVAANIVAVEPALGARIVAAWPAVAMLLVVEILSRTRTRRRALGHPIDEEAVVAEARLGESAEIKSPDVEALRRAVDMSAATPMSTRTEPRSPASRRGRGNRR